MFKGGFPFFSAYNSPYLLSPLYNFLFLYSPLKKQDIAKNLKSVQSKSGQYCFHKFKSHTVHYGYIVDRGNLNDISMDKSGENSIITVSKILLTIRIPPWQLISTVSSVV